jgi:biotin transport system substrate-specific component
LGKSNFKNYKLGKKIMQNTNILTVDKNSIFKNIILTLLGSFFICLFANIIIYLPFSPVPIVMQNSVCLFLGILLGKEKGFFSTLLFLIYGSLGFPVFAGGVCGSMYLLFTASSGYLLSYPIAAYVSGYLYEKMTKKTLMSTFLAISVGHGIILVFGTLVVSLFLGIKKVILVGFLPFVIGDFLKGLLASKILNRN